MEDDGPVYGVMTLNTLRYLAGRTSGELREDIRDFLDKTSDVVDCVVELTPTGVAILQSSDVFPTSH